MAKTEELAGTNGNGATEALEPAANGKAPKAKKEKKSKDGKKKGGIGGIIVLLILVLLVVGFLVAAVFFNLFQIRDKMIGVLSSLDPEYVHYTELAEEQEQRQEELDAREEALISEQEYLEQYAEELDEREAQIGEEEAVFQPVLRTTLTEEKLADLKNLGKIYSSMEAENAATIMPSLYSVSDMAIIFFYMDTTSAAAVMELLDTELAAEITTTMLRN